MQVLLDSWHKDHQQSGADLLDSEREDIAMIRGRDGLFVVPKNDQYVGKSMLAYGEYNPQEQSILTQILSSGMTVVEIGAHMGSHSVGMAKKVGINGEFWGFEPQPFLHQILSTNMLLNGISWAKTYCMGLSDHEGSVKAHWPNYAVLGNYGSMGFDNSVTQGQGEVHFQPFDTFFTGKQLDLLKIDVEGMEAKVLKGAEQSIKKHKPVLYLENDRQQNSAALIEYLWGLDYRLWWSLPPLFSQNNYYQHPFNHFGSVISVNMMCFHLDVQAELSGFTEVKESSEWPL